VGIPVRTSGIAVLLDTDAGNAGDVGQSREYERRGCHARTISELLINRWVPMDGKRNRCQWHELRSDVVSQAGHRCRAYV
jgi:hypothetical protein